MSRYIYHVTMTTGHVRYSPRCEVSDATIERLGPMIDRALTGEHVALPTPSGPGWTLTGGVDTDRPLDRQCCALTLWAPPVGADPVPVLTVGIAVRSRCGVRLWRHLHRSFGAGRLATDAESPPPAPWCADRLEAGALLYPDAMEWTGDLARSLAWAWVEGVAARR